MNEQPQIQTPDSNAAGGIASGDNVLTENTQRENVQGETAENTPSNQTTTDKDGQTTNSNEGQTTNSNEGQTTNENEGQAAADNERQSSPTQEATAAKKPAAWANPTPAGLVALAVACFVFCALLGGHVTRNAMPLLGCFLLGGFVIQIVVALLDLKSGNVSGGNTFLYFSVYFMLVSGIEMAIKYFLPESDTRIDGWAWTALALVVALWTPAFYKSPAILFIIVALLNIACPCIALADHKIFSAEASRILGQIAGYTLLVCGILAIYLSAAMVVNATYGKTILPNPKPFYKEKPAA